VFAVALLASHSILSGTSLLLRDYLIAFSFAGLVYVVIHDQRQSRQTRSGRLGTILAGQSYTLYVVHVPLLVFCRAWLGSDAGQWRPEPATMLYAAGLTSMTLAYAFLISRVTEVHTERCRVWLQQTLRPRRAVIRTGHPIPMTAASCEPRTASDRTVETF
jgi:peptidoglycan/LPS O-acetylase OafA/YrhL